jgi:hypothetical protein
LHQGKHFWLPDAPGDIAEIWRNAQPLPSGDLPGWLEMAARNEYRYLGTFSKRNVSAQEQAGYFAELRQLQAAGAIIDQDTFDRDVHRIFLAAPRKEAVWSIGIYHGDSSTSFAAVKQLDNPILTAREVCDVRATFVADPFMVRTPGGWHMFFEVMNWQTGKGEIGYAFSPDARQWEYRQLVLTEPFHLSYPYVFEWDGDYYMIPETYQAGSVRLYRAVAFPTKWQCVATLLEGPYFVDSSVCHYQGLWWLFTDTSQRMNNDTLRLFYSSTLTGQWQEHPRSPIVCGNARNARPAGRILATDGRLIRYAQSSEPHYGSDVRAFQIDELTPTTYREHQCHPAPILSGTGAGWNAAGMHHVDWHQLSANQWLACVDGWCWG